MPRRTVETIVAIVAVVALALVLLNATLVDRRPPRVSELTLSATAFGDDLLAQTLTAIDLEFSEPVDRASVERRFRIVPYVGGTFTWDRDTVAIFTPAKKLPSATEFTVSLLAGFSDRAGNVAPDDTAAFAFRTVGPPVVLSAEPRDGTAGLAADATVTLTFDRLMDTAAVEASIAVSPAIPYRSSWSGPSLTLTFRAPLAFGTTYTVTVGTDAADTDGSHLTGSYATAFTTVQAGLGVRATVPAGGVSGIGIQTPIAVLFDGPIDPASIVGALRITPPVDGDARVIDLPTDAPVAIAPTGSPSPVPPATAPAGMVLAFTPAQPLAPHTTYTVELAPVVRQEDDAGQVAAGRTWTFTTGGPTTSAQNQIAFLSARGGVRNVWLMNPDGSNPRQVTTELAPVAEYDMARDGRTMVYAIGGVVKRMRLDGADATTLTAEDRFEYAPVLAPDGTAVLVGRRDAAGEDLGYWLVPLPGVPDAPAELQVLAAGAPPLGSTELAGDGLVAGPGVSPWNRRAAFDPTGRHLLLADAAGVVHLIDLLPGQPAGDAAPVAIALRPLVADSAPAWSRDAAAFALVARDPAATEDGAWRIRPTGSAARLFPAVGSVAIAVHGGLAALVGPDRAHLGYTALDARAPAALTTAPDLADRSPTFSPDGTTLLFGRVLVGDPTRSAGIWLVGLDGRDLRQLATDGAGARWLP